MLIHLSDLHFGTERVACMHAIQKFCKEHSPEVVVVSGDLTQRAKFKQFYDCKQFLDSLNTPYFVVPGNHDIPLYHIWNRVFKPFGLFQLFFGGLEQTMQTEHFYLIGLNSIRRRFHTKGHISLAQIQRVDQALIHVPKQKFKIIVSHQPFYTSDQEHHHKDCPILSKIALLEWGKHDLFALLHGHLHSKAVYDLDQIYALHTGHPIYEVHAGTATSHRLHKNALNSFNVILNDGTFQHYIFNEQAQDFILNAN